MLMDSQTVQRPCPDWATRLVMEPLENVAFEQLKLEFAQLGNGIKIPTLK